MDYRANQIRKSRVIVIYALVAAALLTATVSALLLIQWTMRGTGSVKGVGIGVYWDLQCTNATTSLEFGRLEPGSSKSFNLYLRNEGNSAITLSMTLANWDPASAADVMTLTWNREGQHVNPDQVMDIVITLSVSEDVQGITTFSLDIIISGVA